MKKIIEAFLQQHHYNCIDLKAVLFDMDGVLFDSMKNHATAWHRTILDIGIPCTYEEFFLYEGQTGRQTINQLIQRAFGREATEEEKLKIYANKTAHFTALDPAPIMPGASEVVRWVKEKNLTPILVTGSGQLSLLNKLEHSFPSVFTRERMITAHDVDFGKPHPEPYLRGLQKAGVAPHQAIVIENAPLGVRSAVAANLFTIAVNTGPLQSELLYQEGAQIVLPGMHELAHHLEAYGQLFKTTHRLEHPHQTNI